MKRLIALAGESDGRDLGQHPVDPAQLVAQFPTDHPTGGHVGHLAHDLVLGDVPGQLGEAAVGAVAEDVVPADVFADGDPAADGEQVLFSLDVRPVEAAIDPAIDQLGKVGDDELEDLVDALVGRRLLRGSPDRDRRRPPA